MSHIPARKAMIPMMKNNRSANQNRYSILAAGFFFSVLASLLCFGLLRQQEQRNIHRLQALYSERTENLMNRMFHKTDILAAAVKLKNGNITEETFQMIAQLVYEKNSGIRGIQYMPGAVVTYSYPVEGNEEVIGKNFLKIPERRNDVLLAINTKSMVLSGPYHLIQGGLGVVARNPVFLTGSSGEDYFWGFSAIVLNLPDALSSAGLNQLPEEGYDFQLFCDNENGERLVISGNPALSCTRAVCGAIQVPRHTWTLAITSLYSWLIPVKALGVFLVCLLLTIVLWRLARAVSRERSAVLAKDRFFSNISHDMRTPLNAVLGFVSLAQTPGISEAEKDAYLAKIGFAGELLLDLVNDTLTLSKAGSGKIILHPEPCSTQEVGEAFLPTAAELAARKKIQFTVDYTHYRRRTVLADRFNAEKIFLNLLANAIKYTPEGGHVALTVKDEPENSKDPDLIFIIRDDGIGMSEEFLAHVYEPFEQENRSGYESGGTGLGLAIVKQLVDLMGGTIRIDSEINKGTTVTVRLHFPETEAVQTPLRDGMSLNERKNQLAGKKALVCEDNAQNQEIAAALLKGQQMEVVVTENGQAGLAAFSGSEVYEYDFILMDRRMPVMDGLTATREIRKLNRPDAKTVPVIAMTADAFPEDIQACLDAGMNGYIAKPILPERLFELLLKCLSSGSH